MILTNGKKSQAGNWTWKACFQDKQIAVTLNPKWEKAKIGDKGYKQPSFVLMVIGKKDEGFNNTGAVWAFKRSTRLEDGPKKTYLLHQGNMLIDNVEYLVDIKRVGESSSMCSAQLELLITKQDKVEADKL